MFLLMCTKHQDQLHIFVKYERKQMSELDMGSSSCLVFGDDYSWSDSLWISDTNTEGRSKTATTVCQLGERGEFSGFLSLPDITKPTQLLYQLFQLAPRDLFTVKQLGKIIFTSYSLEHHERFSIYTPLQSVAWFCFVAISDAKTLYSQWESTNTGI